MINWYPGHMTKAIRMIEENLPLIDAVIYVLDARAPYSCINPDFNKLIKNKPIIYVLNKAETGDISRIKEWVSYLSNSGACAVTLTATASGAGKILFPLIKNACSEKLKKYEQKGVKRTIKAMVLGVPNTGKSTVINNLCGLKKTVTGNRPGVTRGKQWVRVNDYLELLDTPGTLYPKLSDQRIARRLAYLGSIRDEVVDSASLALLLIDELNAISPNILFNRYKTTADLSAVEILEQIAINRGFKLKGNEPDYDRAVSALFDDFRKNRLGAITLDSVKELNSGEN